MEKRRVVITGLGTVNPLGNTAADSWAAAKAGRCGIGPITQFDTTDFKCKLAGEVKNFDPETVVDKKEARKMARFTLLALAAAAEAIADSGLNTEAEAKNIGVVLSSGIGGLPTIEEQHTRGEEKGMEKVSPYFVPMSIANMAAAQVAIRFGLKGMCTCPVTACAGGTNAVGDAFHRIRDGYETAMVCGGAESCISPLGIGGFTSMKALSTATDPDAASLPFDARRGGFVMGEGSGVLVLEELEHARARGAHIYAEVVGYGANCDAYHFTAPAPGGTGAIDCMKLTLADAGIAPEQVDHINAHGTGTAKNDAAEFLSLHTLFEGAAPSVSSTKSMTGHCLGAAGAIEAVLSVKALTENTVLPTTGYAPEDLAPLAEKAGNLDCVVNVAHERELENVMSNSFAFGGTNASIIFSKKPHPAEQTGKRRICVTGIGELLSEADGTASVQRELTPEDFGARDVKLGFYRKLDRFSQMQVLSGVDALRDAGFTIDADNASRVGSTIGTADGPMAEITSFQKTVCEKGPAAGSAFSFPHTVYNAAGGYLSIFTGLKGFCATIANGTQAGLQSVICACDELRSGAGDAVLAAGTDENSENITEVYSHLPLPGHVVGEGCVTMLLEDAAAAQARGARIYAEILGYAGTHQAARYGSEPAQEQVDRTLAGALQDAGLTAVDRLFTAQEMKARTGDARAASAALALAEACRAVSSGECRTAAALATGWTGSISCVIVGRKEA